MRNERLSHVYMLVICSRCLFGPFGRRSARRNIVLTIKFPQNLMPHDAFLQRIRKTLYVGGHVSSGSGARHVSAPSANSQKISRPLADYAAEYFSDPHRGHTLNRLNSVTVAKLNATPCSLILAMIYMDRLQAADPLYARRITPTELFLVSMVSPGVAPVYVAPVVPISEPHCARRSWSPPSSTTATTRASTSMTSSTPATTT